MAADRLLFQPSNLLVHGRTPALRVARTGIARDHDRFKLRAIMAQDGQQRILRRAAMIQPGNDMDDFPPFHHVLCGLSQRLRRAHQGGKIATMPLPVIPLFHQPTGLS